MEVWVDKLYFILTLLKINKIDLSFAILFFHAANYNLICKFCTCIYFNVSKIRLKKRRIAFRNLCNFGNETHTNFAKSSSILQNKDTDPCTTQYITFTLKKNVQSRRFACTMVQGIKQKVIYWRRFIWFLCKIKWLNYVSPLY